MTDIGIYVGAPNGNDAAAMAATKLAFDQFVALFGKRPTSGNAFEDAGMADPGTSVYSWVQSGDAYYGPNSGVIPCIGIPMAPSSTGDDPASAFQSIIAGKLDAYFSKVISTWAAGYKHLRIRPGYEFNGSFMKWRAITTANAALYQQAFQHIVTVARAEAKALGVTLESIWNAACIDWDYICPASFYPGNDYVDIHGVDLYSPTYPAQSPETEWTADGAVASWIGVDATTWASLVADRVHFWTYQDANQWNVTGTKAGWSWTEAVAFAKSSGKPLAICECGAGGNDANLGPKDEAAFAPFLANAIAAAQAAGVTIPFVNIWATSQSDGAWGFLAGQQPNAAAAWKAAFGAPTTEKLALFLAEDAANGDAQFTVAIDGVVALTGTCTASHAAGQTQSFEIDIAPGKHTVAVAFTNDYCAWINGAYAANEPGEDRNLYFDHATCNGQPVTNATATKFATNGSYSFTVGA